LDFSLDQKTETFLCMHRRALEFFGGVPRKVLYDNLKSVALHHIGPTVHFNPTFLGFAGHCLFEPGGTIRARPRMHKKLCADPCPTRSAPVKETMGRLCPDSVPFFLERCVDVVPRQRFVNQWFYALVLCCHWAAQAANVTAVRRRWRS
jgi:hypothetical protein